jgi:hypothetical protein
MTCRILSGASLRGVWVWAWASALLLGATLVTATAVQPQAPVPEVTVNGCVMRQPDSIPAPPVGHEQEAARGLSLTQVTMRSDEQTRPPRSAVPGSLPSGSGSGTIPDTSPLRGPVSEQQAFWLVGDKAIELARFVDRQAEVVGRFDERNAANPGDADAGAVSERRSTAAPAPRPNPAHPSAPTRVLRVVSFRVLDQSCR